MDRDRSHYKNTDRLYSMYYSCHPRARNEDEILGRNLIAAYSEMKRQSAAEKRIWRKRREPAAPNLRARTVFALACHTDIRISDLCRITAGDYDGFTQTVTLDGCDYPLNDEATAALEDYILWLSEQKTLRAASLLFAKENGQPISRQGIWSVIRNYQVSTGTNESVTPGKLRNAK